MAKKPVDPKDQEALLLERQLQAAMRMRRAIGARDNLLEFAALAMPDPAEPDDINKTRFEVAPHHQLIAQALKKVRDGSIQRLAISMPPRHGKSELASRMFPAWCIGANPYWQIILAGATAEFAKEEFGRKIRNVMETPMYQQVFPGAGLRGGSKAVDALTTKEGGNVKSIGKGGQVVGRGADLFVIDDPYSGREEAMSLTERRKVRQWFASDVISRMMPGGRIVVIHQRWHEDDLIGWLTDPNHPEHNPRVSGKWTHLYLPAIITDPELADLLRVDLAVPEDPEHQFMFGKRPMRPLWPERYGLEFFSEIKSQDSQAFEALYMGNPTPDDGDFFKREHIVGNMYSPAELPKNLRYYTASDHAVSTAQDRDATCMLTVGVDETGTIWLVDCWWERKDTEDVVDAMLDMMQRYRILTWWAEKGHISKSIGPFLRKRMLEEHTFTNVEEVTPAKDKVTRAQAIQGRISMGKVRFPQHAPWMQAALDEMLKFPNGRHDDFVDTLAHIGGGLARQAASAPIRAKQEAPRTGTLAWVKDSSRREARALALRRKGGF